MDVSKTHYRMGVLYRNACCWLTLSCLVACGGDEDNDPKLSGTSLTFSTSASTADEGETGDGGSSDSTGADSSSSGDGDGDGDSSATTGAETTGDGDGDGDSTTSATTTGDGDGDGDGDSTTGSSTTGSSTTGSSTTGSTSTTGGDDGTNGETGCKKVDLLFVIDDSGSMSDQQNKLTDAFPSFMAEVDQALVVDKGIDYRVGVVSTDMAGTGHCLLGGLICGQGHRGRLQHQPDRLNCTEVPTGRWIETGPVADVSAQFRCIASMDGGEFAEQPLEATRAALIDRVSDTEHYNLGFLRDDALLVLVIVTDEDDQSVWEVSEGMGELAWPLPNLFGQYTAVSDYWDMLVNLKGGFEERITVVGLHGDPSNDCPPGSDDPIVTKAPRLHQFLNLAAPNSYWSDLCDEDFTTPLAEALEIIDASCEAFPQPQ